MLTLAGLAVAALCSVPADTTRSPQELVDDALFILVAEAPTEYVRSPERTNDSFGRGLLDFRPLRALKGGIPTRENLRFLGELVEEDDFNAGPVPYQSIRPSGDGPCIAYRYRPGARYLFFLNDIEGRLSPHWVALEPTNEQLRRDFGRDPWFRWVRARLRRAERRAERPRRPARRLLTRASSARSAPTTASATCARAAAAPSAPDPDDRDIGALNGAWCYFWTPSVAKKIREIAPMRSSKVIHVVSCHAEGEVGDVIVGGVAPPPGETLWEQRRFLAEDETLRNFVLNEPRGGVFRHVNLLVPPVDPRAQMGFLIMEPADTPPMSGSNSLCVATVLLETGILPMQEPETELVLEAPGGIVRARAVCADGRVQRVTITNVPSFVDRLDAEIEVEGLGALRVDTAYGGDSFVLVDAAAAGVEIAPANARSLAELGVRITAAANEQLGFRHPDNPDWDHISFCQFTEPLTREGHLLTGRNAVAIRPGKIDRSPTGTGCSARMAVLHARDEMALSDRYLARSIIDSEFQCRIESETTVGDQPAVVPAITGRAWITGTRQLMLDPDDPWPGGYRIADTWPGLTS